MVWNTIAHPKMMDGGASTGTITPYPIKFADPHKMAYFDLIIDMGSDHSKPPVLVHGDYETIKNKILNHEMVISAAIKNVTRNNGTEASVLIMPIQNVPIECINKDDQHIILVDNDWILTPDNTIKLAKEEGVM